MRVTALVFVGLAACNRAPASTSTPVSASASVSASGPDRSDPNDHPSASGPDRSDPNDHPSASASPSVSSPSPLANDFEDQFTYGMLDAGAGSPSALTSRPGFAAYSNARFGFTLDAPRALVAMPDPDNGDGRQWRLGKLVAMTASGMNALDGMNVSCASGPNVTVHKDFKDSCWATGARDGWIFWERTVIAHHVMYSLRFQYAASLKTAMDPIVTHVNASWKF